MTAFHRNPILNSPYEVPARHWVLDESRRATMRLGKHRRGVPSSFLQRFTLLVAVEL